MSKTVLIAVICTLWCTWSKAVFVWLQLNIIILSYLTNQFKSPFCACTITAAGALNDNVWWWTKLFFLNKTTCWCIFQNVYGRIRRPNYTTVDTTVDYTAVTWWHAIDFACGEKQSTAFCPRCDKLQPSPKSGINYTAHIKPCEVRKKQHLLPATSLILHHHGKRLLAF